MFQKALIFIFLAALMSGCALFRSSESPSDADSVMPVEEEPVTNAVPTVIAPPPARTNDTKAAVSAPRISVVDYPSPNYDKRTLPISMIVLHYTAAPLRESLNALTNGRGTNRVSAHYVVAENGTIYRLVKESLRAWHAGVSRWEKINDVNSASIGIEIVNLGHDAKGKPRPYAKAQIESVIKLCLNIQARHSIRAVVGHSDVAPTRKIDPGELFPWKKLSDRGVLVRAKGYPNRAIIKKK